MSLFLLLLVGVDGVFYGRENFIEIHDEENYYLKASRSASGIPSGGYEDYTIFTIFLTSDEPDILAISDNICVSIGSISNNLYFLNIPESYPVLMTILTRYGTGIELTEAKTDTIVYEIDWAGTQFSATKIYSL